MNPNQVSRRFVRDEKEGRTLDDGDDQSTMNDELGELGRSLVRVATVPDEKFRQEAELGDGEVGCE